MTRTTLPPITNKGNSKYAWSTLKVGEYLLIKNVPAKRQGTVLNAGKMYFERHNIETKLVTRRDEHNPKHLRVYRMS